MAESNDVHIFITFQMHAYRSLKSDTQYLKINFNVLYTEFREQNVKKNAQWIAKSIAFEEIKIMKVFLKPYCKT